jgi:acetolactate synthase-1/2/3 large subunit
VPVLALVGQVPSGLEGRGAFQDSSGIGRAVDAKSLFRAIAKYVAEVDAASFWRTLYDALKAALTGRQGPSVLLFARDVYDADVGPRPPWFPPTLAEIKGEEAAPSVDALFRALRDAERPVLIFGTGAERCSAPDEVRRFAIEAAVPVVTTMASPGAFPNDHPLWLGMIGAAGHPSAHAFLNDEADLLVAVGTGLNALTRHPIARGLSRAKVAVVNVDGGEALRTLAPAVLVEADAGATFAALRGFLRETPVARAGIEGYTLTRYAPRLAAPAVAAAPASPPSIRQSEALEVLEAHLPARGHVLYDAGNCAAAALHSLTLPRGVSSTIALGMGGMGYALCAAIGAQLGEPEGARSVVLAGDGAFMMLGFEIHTAAELGLPILFVVFNNGAHGMCATRQALFFEGRVECARYAAVDVATVARGLASTDKLWVGRARTREELVERLGAYAAVGARPGVLELVLEVEEVPPFSIFLDEDAKVVTVPRPGAGERARSAA